MLMKMKTDLEEDVAFLEQMIFPQEGEAKNQHADVQEAKEFKLKELHPEFQLIVFTEYLLHIFHDLLRMRRTRFTTFRPIMLVLLFAKIITITGQISERNLHDHGLEKLMATLRQNEQDDDYKCNQSEYHMQ
ncbi:hypothetical protein IEQ34_013271 [Dendrobium chrysotoxum]|uniref:Uncharacterized protein n=1 Tax=Dendrobium chrysotoxum TaxID=161865 RepID=A0AAV7GP68_DENCH|nr:hypothetical protein IEQ34_013271 [Dendrobium chrysotoxum]